jgi:hypothetical protein
MPSATRLVDLPIITPFLLLETNIVSSLDIAFQ